MKGDIHGFLYGFSRVAHVPESVVELVADFRTGVDKTVDVMQTDGADDGVRVLAAEYIKTDGF